MPLEADKPSVKMTTRPAMPVLQAALFLLLSVTLLPGTTAGLHGKGVYTADPFTSMAGVAGNEAGKPDHYDDLALSSGFSDIVPLGKSSRVFLLHPAPALDRVFSASQARAPPQP